MIRCGAVLPGACLAVVILTGCADKTAQLRMDVARVEGGLNDLRQLQADQVTELSALRAEIRQLAGRLDEFEHSQRGALGVPPPGGIEVPPAGPRVPPPAIVPVTTLEADEALVATLPADVAQRFAAGLARVRSGAFAEAIAVLQETLDVSFGNEWAANVVFWIGISQEGLGDSRRAVSTYIDLVSRFPRHERTPLALFRQGSALIRDGNSKAAQLAFRKLIADFPRSPEASRARERLKDL